MNPSVRLPLTFMLKVTLLMASALMLVSSRFPFPQFYNLHKILSKNCWPICCSEDQADGTQFIVQSGIQIKAIGLILMGLMGVEEYFLAAYKAALHWPEAHPMLRTHRCAK